MVHSKRKLTKMKENVKTEAKVDLNKFLSFYVLYETLEKGEQ